MQNALVSNFISKHVRATAASGVSSRRHHSRSRQIREGDKERLQAFEGTVIARKNIGMGETITVERSASARAWSAFSRCTRQ